MAGDTLQSIAQMLWGDSSLWYVLADANGLSAGCPFRKPHFGGFLK